MKLLRLELENFRAVKHQVVEFPGGANIDVFGANGTGKTTIANAITWLITGEPITGEKEFMPKTTGTHNLHHKAAVLLEGADGHQVTLAKDFYELWVKKRGAKEPEFSGHTTDYSINGVPAKKKEYETAMEAACGGELTRVKVLMILGFFSEALKAEDRRKLLFDVCGDVDDDEVLALPELNGLKDLLKIPGNGKGYYSPDQLKKIRVMERHDLNKELERIPERIDEINMQMTEEKAGDRDKLAAKIQKLQEHRAKLNNATGKEAAREKLASKKVELAEARSKYIIDDQEEHCTEYARIKRLTEEQMQYHKAADEQLLAVKAKERLLLELTEQRQKLLQAFQEVKARAWNGATTCPTCGQPLPEARVQTSREAFMAEKAALKAEINEAGQKCSQSVIQALQTEIENIKAEAEQSRQKEESCTKEIEAIQDKLKQRQPFDDTDTARKLNDEIQQLKEATQAEAEADHVRMESLSEIDSVLREANAKLAQLNMNDSLAERIAELEAKRSEAADRLEIADQTIHLCEEFTRAKVRMVTDNINDKFQTISFKLFKEQINGGLKECCEALIPNQNGTLVDYKSANTAARINAGLEIIEVLGEHYGMNLPVIIDGAESVCEPRKMKQQTIKLIVSAPDDTLRIKEAR